MLIIEDQKYFDEVVSFAKKAGLYDNKDNDSLKSRLDYLEKYGGENNERMRVRLMKDFAPYSFFFAIEKKRDEDWALVFNGGLLFHGRHDGFGSGAAPTFAISLTAVVGWSIHT